MTGVEFFHDIRSREVRVCIIPQTRPFSGKPLMYTFDEPNASEDAVHAAVMLKTKRTNFNELDREHLIMLLEYFRSKLGKKDNSLRKTRNSLNNARTRIDKLKATVAHQRAKIIELMDRDAPGDKEDGMPGDSGRIR